MSATSLDRRLTGRHVLAALAVFFGVIFAMNAALVYYALSSFPGLDVASSYKAGQAFEGDVAAARAQASRGWQVEETAGLAEGGVAIAATFRDRDGRPIVGLDVSARLMHSATTRLDSEVALLADGMGRYSGLAAGAEAGKWRLVLTARKDGERLFLSRNDLMLTR